MDHCDDTPTPPGVTVHPVDHGFGATSFEVVCPAGAGTVTDWGGEIAVYVDQPGRSAVVGSDRFCALTRSPDGTVARFDDRVTEAASSLARHVLVAFDAHPDTPRRLAAAREVWVQRRLETLARREQQAQEVLAAVEEYRGRLVARRAALQSAATDPAAPLPSVEDVRYCGPSL